MIRMNFSDIRKGTSSTKLKPDNNNDSCERFADARSTLEASNEQFNFEATEYE